MHARSSDSTLIRWRNAVFIGFFVQGLTGASWLSRIPAVRDDTGLTVAGTGAILLAGSCGAIIGLAASSVLVARLGARRSLLITLTTGLVGVTVIGIGSSVLHAIWAVGVGLFLWGLGFGSAGVINNVEGAEAERAIGKTLLPLMHGFYSLGTVSGALIATTVTALGISVAVHFSGIALVGAALVAIALSLLPARRETFDDAPTLSKTAWHQRLRNGLAVWRSPMVVLLALSMMGMAFAEGAANDWIALGIVDGHGYANEMGALAFGLFVGGMTLIRVLGGPLIDRWGRVVMFRASVATVFTAVLIFVFGGPLWLALVGAALWGLGIGLSFPTLMSASADAPSGASRVAAVSSVGYATGLIGPPIFGLLGAHLGVLGSLLALLPLLALSFMCGFSARGEGAAAPVAA